MSDFRQDRKSANPLFNKIFLLWHGPCMGFCERISETSSMIMRTENAAAAVKTALSPAIKPPKSRRAMVEAGDCAGFKHLMGLESVSRDGDAGIQTGGKDIRRCPRSRYDPSIVTALERSGPHSTTRTRRTILTNPVGTGARKRPRGAQWLWRYSPRTTT
ncbi:hypothetical protein [Mesorhizobium sp. M1329]|uniref:hypothetical protein n=1 Tax=Mesorhizobium sp. M1329 TaxID=2957083 RepID=UPI003334EBC2